MRPKRKPKYPPRKTPERLRAPKLKWHKGFKAGTWIAVGADDLKYEINPAPEPGGGKTRYRLFVDGMGRYASHNIKDAKREANDIHAWNYKLPILQEAALKMATIRFQEGNLKGLHIRPISMGAMSVSIEIPIHVIEEYIDGVGAILDEAS